MTRLRLALLVTATAAAAATGACSPKPLSHRFGSAGVHVQTSEAMDTAVSVASTLACPAEVGELRRTAVSADGAACDYQSDKGLVHLAFVDAGADASGALAPLRSQLDSELPGVAQSATIQVVSDRDANGEKHAKVDMPFLHVDDTGSGDHKHAKVDMPFLHVEDNGDGHAHVRMMGINIDSKDSDRHADKDDDDDDDAGNTTGAAATPPEKRGRELVYVLVSGKPSTDGYHVVGYVAKGAPTGKLVAATFRYRSDKGFHSGDHDDGDIDQLMSLNVKPQ